MQILWKDDNILENFESHEDEESIMEKLNIEGDYRNLIKKSSNTRSYIRNGFSKRTPQDKFLVSRSSLSLKEIRFS